MLHAPLAPAYTACKHTILSPSILPAALLPSIYGTHSPKFLCYLVYAPPSPSSPTPRTLYDITDTLLFTIFLFDLLPGVTSQFISLVAPENKDFFLALD